MSSHELLQHDVVLLWWIALRRSSKAGLLERELSDV